MTCYNGMAARNYAHEQGELEDIEIAREQHCNNFLKQELISIQKYPMGEHRHDDLSVFSLFIDHQDAIGNPLEEHLSRLLAEFAGMNGERLAELRDYSSSLADAIDKIQDGIHDMYLEEASGEFDERLKLKEQGDV